jgi:hypothetical protein
MSRIKRNLTGASPGGVEAAGLLKVVTQGDESEYAAIYLSPRGV